MQRRNFFRGLAGLLAVATSAKELVGLAKTPPVPIVTDTPGIGKTAFTVKLDKSYFMPDDIIRTMEGDWYSTGDKMVHMRHPEITAHIVDIHDKEWEQLKETKACLVGRKCSEHIIEY